MRFVNICKVGKNWDQIFVEASRSVRNPTPQWPIPTIQLIRILLEISYIFRSIIETGGLSYDPYLIRRVSKGSGPRRSGSRRPLKTAFCLELPAIHEGLPAHNAAVSISHFISNLVLLLILDSSFGRLKTYFSLLRPDGETFSGGSWASSWHHIRQYPARAKSVLRLHLAKTVFLLPN